MDKREGEIHGEGGKDELMLLVAVDGADALKSIFFFCAFSGSKATTQPHLIPTAVCGFQTCHLCFLILFSVMAARHENSIRCPFDPTRPDRLHKSNIYKALILLFVVQK